MNTFNKINNINADALVEGVIDFPSNSVYTFPYFRYYTSFNIAYNIRKGRQNRGYLMKTIDTMSQLIRIIN